MKRRSTARKLPFLTTGSIDSTLASVIVMLSVFGAVMVYSGSVLVAVRQGNEPTHYFIRQLIWVIAGLAIAYVLSKIDYHFLAKYSLQAIILSIFLLIAVLILNHDQAIKRWIDLGAFDLQPSELTKLAFVFFLSSWLAKQKERTQKGIKAFKEHFYKEMLPFLLWLGAISILIIMQPDLDTTLIIAITAFIVYFISGNDNVHLLGSTIILIGSAIVGSIATTLASYRIDRLATFFDFWKNGFILDPFGNGYQMRQILVAVASGGLFGVGFGESRQKFHYLGDTAFSDTIFAIFAEEFGFIGIVVMVSIFLFIMIRGYKIAKAAPDKLGFLLAVSITTWITLQAFLHIGANVALIPINGNTLPFMSYGGSSTVVNLAAIGVLLNISAQVTGNKRNTTIERVRSRKN